MPNNTSFPQNPVQSSNSPQQIVNDHYNNSSSNNYYLAPEKEPFLKVLFKGFIRWLFDSVQVIIIALAIFIVFYLFIVSPHTIDGPSMMPTFCNKDFVLADKITPKFRAYERGDVIIFKHDESNDYIKRIIGIGGDRIKIQAGRVYLNDKLLEETYLPSSTRTKLTTERLKEGQSYTVPEGKYFVLGDNRDNSLDSRSFLAIDPNINSIKGRAMFIMWPFDRTHIFDKTKSQPQNNCDAK